MRPQSILMFERLFLLSLAVSALSFVVSYEAMLARLTREPGVAELGLGGGFLTTIFALGMALYLLLWFLIARKASNIAKWVLVVILAVNFVSLASSLARGFAFDLQSLVGLAVYGLEVAAASFLFRADAVAWLKGTDQADPATFE